MSMAEPVMNECKAGGPQACGDVDDQHKEDGLAEVKAHHGLGIDRCKSNDSSNACLVDHDAAEQAHQPN